MTKSSAELSKELGLDVPIPRFPEVSILTTSLEPCTNLKAESRDPPLCREFFTVPSVVQNYNLQVCVSAVGSKVIIGVLPLTTS